MKPEEIKNEIRKLPVSERLILVEDLWDDIVRSGEVPPLRDWQKQALDERLDEFQTGSVKTIDLKLAHLTLKRKHP